MTRWGIFIPAITLVFTFYFQYIDRLFSGKVKIYQIDQVGQTNPSPREIRNTIVALLLFCMTGAFTGYSIDHGWTKVYSEFTYSLSGMSYLFLSFLIAALIHDIYFYLTHRLLHVDFVFKHIHAIHHKSHNTNAWSAFSFHPVEGLVQIGIVPLVAFFLPIQETVFFAFTGFLLFMSVYGHAGYELRANKQSALDIFNTSLHHYQHHKYVKYNFGIYFNLWDRLFGTNHPNYSESLTSLRSRIRKEMSEAMEQKKATDI
jgi:lathosterol oxidase